MSEEQKAIAQTPTRKTTHAALKSYAAKRGMKLIELMDELAAPILKKAKNVKHDAALTASKV